MSDSKRDGLGISTPSEKPKTLEEHVADYIKGSVKAEEEIKLLREHLRDFKKSFIENNYLSKSQVKLLEKAKKLIKDNSDIDQLVDMIGKIKGTNVTISESSEG